MLSVVSAIRDLDRLREITSVLVRHGFGEVVARAGFGRRASSDPAPAAAGAPEISSTELAKGEDEKKRISTAERVRLVLQDLGPSFIKLGQIASTRTDVLPAEVIAELKKLQDSVPSVPFSEIKASVEGSLGAPLEEVFASFEEAPLATASIGQVHRATLQTEDGPQAVVVKVQRANVGAVIQRDLELLHVMAAALERTLPESRVYSPAALVAQFDRSITAELDFSIEAENAERFAKNFEGSREAAFARFPRVYRKASSKRVLTLEFFDGVKIDRAVAAGVDGKDLVKRAVGVIAKMAFEDGFFHADPHPGNILVLGKEDPVLGIIDLGMVGRLTPDMRDRIVDLLVAAARKDAVAVADALYAVGRPTKKVDMREYRAHVASLAEKYLGKPLKDIELGAMIRDLAQGAMKYEIEVPAELMLVGKALMTLESIGKELDPDLDLVAEAQPYFVRVLKQRYSPQRLGSELIRGVEQLSRAGYDMPLQAREVLEDLRLGRLVVGTRDPGLPKVADRLGRRVFMGMVVAAATIAGAIVSAHSVGLAAALFVVAGLLFTLHVVVDWRRARD